MSEFLQAGKFDQRCTVLVPPAVTNSFGAANPGISTSYTPLRQVWAYIRPMRGYEVMQSERDISALFVTIGVRYQSGKDIVENMLIKHNVTGKSYNIQAISHVETGRQLIEFTCKIVT